MENINSTPKAISRETAFSYPMIVRDYECDLHGIVNNAVYLNYGEHARHRYLKSQGFDFAEITARGHYFVAVRQEIDYRAPLRSGDEFYVSVWSEKPSPRKIYFYHDFYKIHPTEKLICQLKSIITCMNPEGKVIPFEEYNHLWL